MNFNSCDNFVRDFEKAIKNPVKDGKGEYFTGVDLGTAFVVLAVVDEAGRPVAGAYEYAEVVKDGMVVDYMGAVALVKRLKEELERKLGRELIYAAGAIPPGTDSVDGGAVKNVIQAAGFEITNLLDEVTAANLLLKVEDGCVVDIGGGTTGVSIIKSGKVVSIIDEPTGGTHLSLVIAGGMKKDFRWAEEYKRQPKNHRELFPVVRPVMDKISSIIAKATSGYDVDAIVLVGGSSCFTGIEEVIEKNTGIHTYKPKNPLFVTPLGIALSCSNKIME